MIFMFKLEKGGEEFRVNRTEKFVLECLLKNSPRFTHVEKLTEAAGVKRPSIKQALRNLRPVIYHVGGVIENNRISGYRIMKLSEFQK
jgi:hypothetical protein